MFMPHKDSNCVVDTRGRQLFTTEGWSAAQYLPGFQKLCLPLWRSTQGFWRVACFSFGAKVNHTNASDVQQSSRETDGAASHGFGDRNMPVTGHKMTNYLPANMRAGTALATLSSRWA
jgi:hypothetical protein